MFDSGVSRPHLHLHSLLVQKCAGALLRCSVQEVHGARMEAGLDHHPRQEQQFRQGGGSRAGPPGPPEPKPVLSYSGVSAPHLHHSQVLPPQQYPHSSSQRHTGLQGAAEGSRTRPCHACRGHVHDGNPTRI